MNRRLFISDLDGTLLASDGTLSPVSRSLLNQLLQEGLAFTVASARSVHTMRQVLAGLELRLPAISFNGAFISDLPTGRHHVINALSRDALGACEELLRRYDCHAFVSTYDGSADRLYPPAAPLNPGMQAYLENRSVGNDPRLRPACPPAAVFGEHVVCLTVIHRQEVLVPLQTEIMTACAGGVVTYLYDNMYDPGWHWLTVHDANATKARAVRALQERCGFGDRELVCFGDAVNDLPLLQAADRAIAVANADPAVKRHAHLVIGSNEDHSVARHIHDLCRSAVHE